MIEFLTSMDMWFYCLIAMAVLLRILYFDEKRPTIRSAFFSALAAFIVAKTFIEPTLEWIPSEEPEKYRDALVVAYALTGTEILRGLLFAVRNPKEAAIALKALVWKKA